MHYVRESISRRFVMSICTREAHCFVNISFSVASSPSQPQELTSQFDLGLPKGSQQLDLHQVVGSPVG